MPAIGVWNRLTRLVRFAVFAVVGAALPAAAESYFALVNCSGHGEVFLSFAASDTSCLVPHDEAKLHHGAVDVLHCTGNGAKCQFSAQRAVTPGRRSCEGVTAHTVKSGKVVHVCELSGIGEDLDITSHVVRDVQMDCAAVCGG